MAAKTSLAAPVVQICAHVAAHFRLPADQLYRIEETEFLFPGDFVLISYRRGRRFGIVTETGVQLSTRTVSPAEYEPIGRAIPLIDYG